MMQYYNVESLLHFLPEPNASRCKKLYHDFHAALVHAPGSSHNHQAWAGGYLDHVAEVMNIASRLFSSLGELRKLPFTLDSALLVLFLHDLEKPFKYAKLDDAHLAPHPFSLKTKAERKAFREHLIQQYKIELTEDERNALQYVEGVPDSEYTPGARTMGELAAFCHMCDIASARLWHDHPREKHEQWGYRTAIA